MSRIRRAWHPELPPMEEAPGVVVTLGPEESHHLTSVLRLSPGDRLSVFDGRGEEWAGEVDSVGRSGVNVRLLERMADRVDPAVSVALFQGLCRADRMDWIVQKATEVGVASIRPVRALRSEGGAPTGRRLERWRRIAREACKQSGRRWVPELAEVVVPAEMRVGPEAAAFVLHPGEGAPGLGRRLGELPGGTPEIRLAVGPEGGFAGDEVEGLRRAGWREAGLGPRTLRTETAGIVAVALVLDRLGELG